MDGRPWRLKRGRDFNGDIRLVREEAKSVAAATERGVRIAKDRGAPEDAFWVQFADAEISLGDPCPCGATLLERRHRNFARCHDCGRLLALQYRGERAAAVDDDDDEDEDDVAVAGMVVDDEQRRETPTAEEPPTRSQGRTRTVDEFSDVHLLLAEERDDRRLYVGYGFEASEPVLLQVVVNTHDGAPIDDPASRLGWRHKAVPWPVGPLGQLVDVERLRDRSEDEWDLVVR